ncbi:MAG: TM0106 family RecB-like putative nuclease [Planctomycetes bacterium]|nr:TM0106 family RecB-like putative nuclease [Planctomycetota bacterium]
MYRAKGDIIFSPSDLIRFVSSPFASWMDRMFLEHPSKVTPDEEDGGMRLLAEMGDEHETNFLQQQHDDGRDVCEIERGKGDEKATLEAIKQRRDVIFQAALSGGRFRGYADFLVRTDDENDPYEVWDTKLAREAKPHFLIQLCCYAEMLEQATGIRPAYLGVVLGTREVREFRTDDFWHHYLAVKQAFLAAQDSFDPDTPPAPQPGANHGRWQSHAEQIWEDADHLCRVANMRTSQIRRLQDADIDTLTKLAKTKRSQVKGIGDEVFTRLREQAALQLKSDGLDVPEYRAVPPSLEDPRRGLALLPPASKLDVYFDMEGYPLIEGGLEYLFGAVTVEKGKPVFRDWWGHDAQGERAAFEGFVDWAHARWKSDPKMHIYHYAPYEVTALRRLAGQYGTREDEVDDLLRNDIFVDLYTVVRGGLRVGTRSYSLKALEPLYRGPREGDVTSAMDSILQYERWMSSGEPPDCNKSPLLNEIRNYNKDDCESTWQLAEWLRERQTELAVAWIPSGSAEGKKEEDRPLGEDTIRRRELSLEMLSEIPELVEEDDEDDEDKWRLQELLAQLVEFHRREDKPMWWARFERHAMSHHELAEDLDCLGALKHDGKPAIPEKRSFLFTYDFDPEQDTKMAEGHKAIFAHDLSISVEIHKLDPKGSVTLKVGPSVRSRLPGGEMPAELSLIPDEFVDARVISDAIESVASNWRETGELPSALQDVLLRNRPRIKKHKGGRLLRSGKDVSDEAIRLVSALDGSALCIQGPPGSGKTYTGSRIIASLLEAGLNVGVTSNSHKAVLNLFSACNDRLSGELQCLKVGGDRNDPFFDNCEGADFTGTGGDAHKRYRGGLIGGTAWLFCRPEWEGELDYLFVDEAGQMSLANLVGMARSARNIVLLGDQMQLGQPSKGSHPGESGLSVLDYLLGDQATIAEDMGIFLPTSWRMHPDVCQFISDAVYEGRLKPEAHTAKRKVLAPKGASLTPAPAGVVFVPVEHEGNAQASEEEVEVVRDLVAELLTRQHTNEKGKKVGTLEIGDILIVAPYNMQVRKLRRALPDGARVASVDKFQGQQAPVVIVSMCASPGEFGSRGLEFLMNKNRINVAISRAQSLAVVVGDPRLALTACGSIEDMKRVSLFSRAAASSPMS